MDTKSMLNEVNQLLKEKKEVKNKIEWFYIQLTISLVNNCIGGDNEVIIGNVGRDKDSFRIKLRDDEIYINLWESYNYSIEIEKDFGWGRLTDGKMIQYPYLKEFNRDYEWYPLEDIKIKILQRCYNLSKNKKYLYSASMIAKKLFDTCKELKNKQYKKYLKTKDKEDKIIYNTYDSECRELDDFIIFCNETLD